MRGAWSSFRRRVLRSTRASPYSMKSWKQSIDCCHCYCSSFHQNSVHSCDFGSWINAAASPSHKYGRWMGDIVKQCRENLFSIRRRCTIVPEKKEEKESRFAVIRVSKVGAVETHKLTRQRNRSNSDFARKESFFNLLSFLISFSS